MPTCSIRSDEHKDHIARQVQKEGYAWRHPPAKRSAHHIRAVYTRLCESVQLMVFHKNSNSTLSCPSVTAWTCAATAQECSQTSSASKTMRGLDLSVPPMCVSLYFRLRYLTKCNCCSSRMPECCLTSTAGKLCQLALQLRSRHI